jgi:transposase
LIWYRREVAMAVWAYAVDLRERVVGASEAGGLTDEEVAEIFGIGEASVHRWKRLHRERGSLEPRKHQSGNHPTIPPDRWDLVRQIVHEEPDLTIAEVANEYWRRSGRQVSRSAMCRVLLKLELTRKKSR